MTTTLPSTTVGTGSPQQDNDDGIAGVSLAVAGIFMAVSVSVAMVIGVLRALTKSYPKEDPDTKKVGSADATSAWEDSDQASKKLVDARGSQYEAQEDDLRVAAEGESPAVATVQVDLPRRPWSAPGGSRRDARKIKQKVKKSQIVDDDLIPARQRRQTDMVLQEVDDPSEGLADAANSPTGKTLHPQQVQVGNQKSSGSRAGRQNHVVNVAGNHQTMQLEHHSGDVRLQMQPSAPGQRLSVSDRALPASQLAATSGKGQTLHGPGPNRGTPPRAMSAWLADTPSKSPVSSPMRGPVHTPVKRKPASDADPSARAASRYLMNFLRYPGSPGNTQAAPAVATAAAMLAARMWGPLQCKCGSMFMSDEVHCRTCGARREVEQCEACGVPFMSGDTFCGQCGGHRHKADVHAALEGHSTHQPSSSSTSFCRSAPLRTLTLSHGTSPESLSRIAPRPAVQGNDSDNTFIDLEAPYVDAQHIEDHSDVQLETLHEGAEATSKPNRLAMSGGIREAWPADAPLLERSPSKKATQQTVEPEARGLQEATQKVCEPSAGMPEEAWQLGPLNTPGAKSRVPNEEASQKGSSKSLEARASWEVKMEQEEGEEEETQLISAESLQSADRVGETRVLDGDDVKQTSCLDSQELAASMPEEERARQSISKSSQHMATVPIEDTGKQEEIKAVGLNTSHNPQESSSPTNRRGFAAAAPPIESVQANPEKKEPETKESGPPLQVLKEISAQAGGLRTDYQAPEQKQAQVQEPNPADKPKVRTEEKVPVQMIAPEAVMKQEEPLASEARQAGPVAHEPPKLSNLALLSPSPSSPISTMHDAPEPLHPSESTPQVDQGTPIGTEPKDSSVAESTAPADGQLFFEETMSLHQLMALEKMQESLSPAQNKSNQTLDETPQPRLEEESDAFKQLTALEVMASSPVAMPQVETSQSEVKAELTSVSVSDTGQLLKKTATDEFDAAFKQLEALEKLAASKKERATPQSLATNAEAEQPITGASPADTPRPGMAGSLDPPFIPMQPPSSRSSDSSNSFPRILRQPVPTISWNATKISGRAGDPMSARSGRSVSTAPSVSRSPHFGSGTQKYGMYRASFNSSNSDSDDSLDTVH